MKQSNSALLDMAFLATLALQPVAAHAGGSTYPDLDVGPKFSEKGELLQPEGFREWVFIGSPLTPHGLNDGNAGFPEFHNVYVEPAAYRYYRRTGMSRTRQQPPAPEKPLRPRGSARGSPRRSESSRKAGRFRRLATCGGIPPKFSWIASMNLSGQVMTANSSGGRRPPATARPSTAAG